MKNSRFLNIKGALLEQNQLASYLEKIASEYTLQKYSKKNTYPIFRLDDNFKRITKTYEKLNNDFKLEINIHPAGEWLLDNYYVIEETYKKVKKDLTLNKYTKFPGIANGEYKGFARIYLLASQIIAYTDGQIDGKKLQLLLTAYQTKKTLTMEEIWNISNFLYIALIEQIKDVCEKIYFAQVQKYKVESILERLVEKREKKDLTYIRNINNEKLKFSKEPFIEYLSYRLNQYGKKGIIYLKILEEEVEKTGTTVAQIIKKEHFDIALKKLWIGNCIKSIKNIQRINFVQIFEETNEVEEILIKDPAKIYNKMTHKTKEHYRNKIKEIALENKMSEIYVTAKALELANINKEDNNEKKRHIGYYILDNGIYDLQKKLNNLETNKHKKNNENKIFKNKSGRKYIILLISLTSIISLISSYVFLYYSKSILLTILFLLVFYIPISEIVIKILQYVLSKIVKPQFIPKIDFGNGIPEEYATMVIIPTILKSKENVKEMLEKLEVYYLANKSKNLYFSLLGDCSTSSKEKEEYDNEIIEEGKKCIKELNKKYKSKKNIFNFVYRKRIWIAKENSFLGWERKRGLINEFNNYLLGKKNNTFLYNSLDEKEIPKIKYVITLDSDTNLVLDSAKELIGAMAHILNKPIINEEKNIVAEGYGILQPRIGVDIYSSRRTLFTKIFAGMGGTDPYSGAISDIYQDNFGEGTFTGKGIYDLEVFQKVLNHSIPEETVLSHDLLEGLYARCGLVTDIVLLDSYPTKFNSYIIRNNRWIRGDWQIINWIRKEVLDDKKNKIKNPINELGKFKILDNLRRSLLEITQVLTIMILTIFSKSNFLFILTFLSIFIELIIDIFNTIIFKKYEIKKQALFENNLPGLKLSLVRSIVNFSSIIYKAINSLKSIIVTIYRVFKTKEHLLEWITADEAEKKCKEDIVSYYKEMWFNTLAGILLFIYSLKNINIILILVGILWIIAPTICCNISKKQKEENKIKELDKKEIKELIEIAKKTWKYFEDFADEENNFLIPDNYQESREKNVVDRTSSTNIGLTLMSIMSAYDLKFITLEKSIFLISKVIETIKKLPKWNGHLYNWYNIKTLTPLKPEYISTVDSGNFIGYCITLRKFLEEIKDEKIIKEYSIIENIEYISKLIKETDFSKLYNEEISLFSVGFNIEENKLTDSYYDLLASEARQASLVAIAKHDVPLKHWNTLGRPLTSIDGKKGLVSWSGTSFEYLMPNINIKTYKGSLIDESIKFMILSQQKYCNKLNIPWGISEAAFNLKDLNSNYQYKAFGIPWLGFKRGLADEIVISSYGSLLALTEKPKEVMKNIKTLKKYQMYGKYGLFEAIDFTPERLSNGKEYEVVKTYMAHHQALIILSINNLINNNIINKRFHSNPEIKAVDILLQEKMPEDMIITKERKEKIEKIKYKFSDSNYRKEITDFNTELPNLNVISNENYTICINKDGSGFSKYKDILVNRFKPTNDYAEGIFFYFKNTKSKEIWSSCLLNKEENFKVIFENNMSEIINRKNKIQTKIKIIVTPNDNVEIRSVEIENFGDEDEIIEISSVLEPVLSNSMQDYAHKAFNNLFLKYEKIDNGILIKRNKRGNLDEIFMATGFFINEEDNLLEYEIDKEKLFGRLNSSIPDKIKKSEKFSNTIGMVVNPILAFRRTIKIPKHSKKTINLVISVNEKENQSIENLNKYKSFEKTQKAFGISKIRNEENARYLQVNSKEMEIYQKMLSYILQTNPLRKLYIYEYKDEEFSKEDLWKYGISGDYPIILVKIEQVNDVYVVKNILKSFIYFKNKNIITNIVIINEEKNVYERYVKDAIEKEIIDKNLLYLLNKEIFILNENEIKNIKALIFLANFIIDAKRGSLENIILELEEDLEKYLVTTKERIYEKEENFKEYNTKDLDLLYKNKYGGFSKDGKEYIICTNKDVPAPWSNVLANQNFGTIVTQNLGGYSWYKNSRLNRISKWSNDAVLDSPSEKIYVKDNKKFWRIGDGNLLVTNGFGYSKFKQDKLDLKQNLEVFVSMEKNIKINLLKLKNNTNNERKIEIIYEIDSVLDEDEIKSNGNIYTEYIKEQDFIYSKNLCNSEINNISYIYSSEKIENYTGNYNSINLYSNWTLNKENALGNKPCMAIKVSIMLKAFEEKEISFVLGAEENIKDVKLEYKEIEKCLEEYKKTVSYWNDLLEKVKVKTPNEKINIILNGWAMYQTISSRLFARSRILSVRWSFWF